MLQGSLQIFLMLFGIVCGHSLAGDFDQINPHITFANKMKELVLEKDSNISLGCKVQIAEYIQGLKSGTFWALMMFDAGAKPPSGIFEGNLVELGSFDECLKIENNFLNKGRILGKYCLPTMSIGLSSKLQPQQSRLINISHFEVAFGVRKPKAATEGGGLPIKFATCVPNACSAGDIQKIYAKGGLKVVLSEEDCQTKATQPKIDAGGIAALSFFGVVLWIIVACTIYDTVISYLQRRPIHPLLIAFSVLTNGKKLLATSNGPNQISCLHGIRVISTMWVIIGHRYVIQFMYPLKNNLYLADWMEDQANMFIMGATVSVDTFFIMAGLVISYLYMTSKKEFNVILYYIHRYLRLTPPLAIVVLIHVTLLQHLGSGPLWPSIKAALIDNCDKDWWKTLLYIQNYGGLDVCISQTWYLAVDMQLFILSPILLLPLKKWPSLTLSATAFLTICSILSCFLIAWYYGLNGSLVGNHGPASSNYMKKYYTATWTRAAPWLIGILLGYYIFKAKQRRPVSINKVLVLCLWTASLAVLCTCVFAGHTLSIKEYNKLENSFYIALVRPAWSVAVGWVIFACATGHGGPINWFLSLPVFQIVSKFTFSLYLVHYTIIFITTVQMRATPIISNPREMYIFWGDFAFSFVVAVLLTLAFESPIITIEKCIFGPAEGKQTKQPRSVQNTEKTGEIP